MENVLLIVANNASRTGAPMLLLNLLKWIRKNSSLEFIFIMQSGGELLDEFGTIGEVFLWEKIKSPAERPTPLLYIANKVYRKLFRQDEAAYVNSFFRKLKQRYSIQLIVSNTAVNYGMLSAIKKVVSAKIITYVHEGERLLEINNVNGSVSAGLQLSDQIIAVSNSVKQVLINKFNVAKRIQVIPGALNTAIALDDSGKSILVQEKIPLTSLKIMACGYPVWQKGIDFFMQIVAKLSKERNDIHFIWLGGENGDEGISQLLFDINKLNLSGRVTLISNKPNALDYINLADILLVPSRNESFSMVSIEAGYLKKPILCFNESGGPCEIVDFDSRFIVPFADINAMCERIKLLADDAVFRIEMGKYLHKRVLENYALEKSGSGLLKILDDSIKI